MTADVPGSVPPSSSPPDSVPPSSSPPDSVPPDSGPPASSPPAWSPPASTSPGSTSPVSTLRRIANTRRAAYDGERCEMCAEAIGAQHQHVVDLETRGLMCTCRGCYLLFTSEGAQLRHRAVPERYLSFPDFRLGPGQWEELEIPVGLAFFFHNSRLGRTIAFYPGPAGATESELPLDAWESVVTNNPGVDALAPDTEALIIRAPGANRPVADAHLVPIDACYELVGLLRQVWRGFDGGQDARSRIELWFDRVAAASRPYSQVRT